MSDEAQVLRFRDEVLQRHGRDHVSLVFSNAGIGGGGSFVSDSREEWERTFGTDWCGVYYCARAFVPLLVKSDEGVLVNTSSVNGLWASMGPGAPQTAYATAKFAVRGFSEALIEDLRTNAPHVKVCARATRARRHRHHREHHARARPVDPTDHEPGRAGRGQGQDDRGRHGRRRPVRRRTAPDHRRHRHPVQRGGAGQRGAGGHHHPGRGARGDLADPDRPEMPRGWTKHVRANPEGAYDYAEFFKTAAADFAASAEA